MRESRAETLVSPAIETLQLQHGMYCNVSFHPLFSSQFFVSFCFSRSHIFSISLSSFFFSLCTLAHAGMPLRLLHHITDSLCKALNSAREPEQLLTQRARPSLSPAATQPDQLSLALCCLWKLLWLNCHDFSYVCSKRLWTERNGEGRTSSAITLEKKLLMNLWCERDRLSEARWREGVRLW